MSSIEQAEEAFDAALGNSAAAGSEVAKSETSKVSLESIFPLRLHEDDVEAGGDDLPNPIRRPVEREARAAVEGEVEADDLEEILYGRTEDQGDDQDDDQGQDQGGDQGEPAGDLPEGWGDVTVTAIVDGEEVEVTLSEAIAGYQRTETFHRRMNQLGDIAKNLEAKANEVTADRAKALEMIDQLGEQLAEFLPPEPNWDEEFKKDGNKARLLQKNYETLRNKIVGLAKQRAKVAEELAIDRQKQLNNFIAVEKQKIFAANPHWADEKKMARDLSSMARTLRAAGYTDEEIKHLYDSRQAVIALKASKYDRMTAKRPQASQRGKTLTVQSGAGRVRTAPKAVQKAQSQLSKTGRVEDAAAVFQHIIK